MRLPEMYNSFHKGMVAASILISCAIYIIREDNIWNLIIYFPSIFLCLYCIYCVLYVAVWVLFSGKAGTGLRLVPRTASGIAWAFRLFYRAISKVLCWGWYGVQFIARTTRNAQERRKWEQGRPERERQAVEAEKAERLRIEEERRQREIDEENAHKRRVARESELTEARAKAELAARLEMQEEANRLAREHEQHMLAIEQERLSIAEKRGKRHEALLGTLSDLVEKSKG